MNDLLKKLNKNIKKFLEFLKNNPLLLRYLKLSLALSSFSLITYILLKKRKPALLLALPDNIGYLRLIKPDINTYSKYLCALKRNKRQELSSSNFVKFVKRFYSIPNGITNYGTNCYINVLLQCLASNPDFILFAKKYCESQVKYKKNSEEFLIAKEISEILGEINSDKSVISANELVNVINNKYEFEYEQQDSYELYHRLLEIFENSHCNSSCSTSEEYENPFNIQLESSYKCEKCKNCFKKNEILLDISLSPTNNIYSVTSLLANYFLPSTISDYTCSKCTLLNIIDQIRNILINKYDERFLLLRNYLNELCKANVDDDVDVINVKIDNFCEENGIFDISNRIKLQPIKTTLTKTSKIQKYPKIMTIHVSKVFYSDYVFTNKRSIIFPEVLKFPENNSGHGVVSYELTSMIEHFGQHNFGHYVAYRKFHDKWVFISDSKATLVIKSKAFQVPNPYMLFYRLVEDSS